MKRLAVFMVVAFIVSCALLVVIPSTVKADEVNWTITLKASSVYGGSGDPTTIGWRYGFTNGKDPGEIITPPIPSGNSAYIVAVLSDGTPSLADYKAPWTNDQTKKTWMLNAYNAGMIVDPIRITVTQTSASFPYDSAGSMGIYWPGGSAIFDKNHPLTTYTFTINGASFYNPAQVYVTVPVPEPSAFAGLLCGMSGFGMLIFRKRK